MELCAYDIVLIRDSRSEILVASSNIKLQERLFDSSEPLP